MNKDHFDTIEIKGIADWVLLPGENKIVFEGGEIGYREIIGHPLLSGKTFLIKFIDANHGIAIVADCYGDTIYKLIGKTGDILSLTKLNRSTSQDRGLMFSKFIETPTRILFIYEFGIVALDRAGELVWQHSHDRLDYLFSSVEKDLVLYTSEQQGKWAYQLIDGTVVGTAYLANEGRKK